ncbi:hypothetical protein Tco_1077514 [Tanacetum coccineum]
MEREKPASMSASRSSPLNGQALANGVEENSGGHEEGNGDYDSASKGSTMDPDGNDDEEELDDDARDTAERDGQVSDEDDEIHVRQKVMLVDLEEEADFCRESRASNAEMEKRRKGEEVKAIGQFEIAHYSTKKMVNEKADQILNELRIKEAKSTCTQHRYV